MEQLKMHSMNKVDENIKRIGALYPNCVTERINADGKVEYAIDFDMLRQELSTVVVEGNEERYQFTWPDKKKSILAPPFFFIIPFLFALVKKKRTDCAKNGRILSCFHISFVLK